MKVIVSNDHLASSLSLAREVIDYIRSNPKAVLCFAGGNSPLQTYDFLVEAENKGEVSFSEITFVLLDEWVGIGNSTYGSCIQTLNDKLYHRLNLDYDKQVIAFDGLASDIEMEVERVKSRIDQLDGIDFSILGIGMNGHLGFNEPGCDPNMSVGVVKLDKVTVEVGQKYFKTPLELELGMTVGLGYLMKSKCIALIANGKSKKDIVHKTIESDISNLVPSTLVRNHPFSSLYVDEDAM